MDTLNILEAGFEDFKVGMRKVIERNNRIAKDRELLRGVTGSRTMPRDHHVHLDQGEVMGKISINGGQLHAIRKLAHDDVVWKLDEDPQGSGLPFKQYVISDKAHKLLSKAGRRIEYSFPNGYGLSVVMGGLFYTDELRPYEVCPLYKGDLIYGALDPNNEDVYPYQTDEELMIMIAKLIALPTLGESK